VRLSLTIRGVEGAESVEAFAADPLIATPVRWPKPSATIRPKPPRL